MNIDPKKQNAAVLLGAAFIMATSAIGPGFLTQSAHFTEVYGASFGFVILVSILLNLVVQVNIWRIIGVAKLRGQDIANKVLPGLGYFLAILVAFGGLAFNIGNIGGAALGINVITGLDIQYGSLIAGIAGILIFVNKDAGPVIDKVTKTLGGMMILIVAYVAVTSGPPVGEAIYRTFLPLDPGNLLFPTITLLGGTVGGYITFAGAHRLIDAGISGEENLGQITRSAVMGIGVASIMRVLFFLAILGVVYKGVALDPSNPAADAFRHGAGNIGYLFFGLVLTAAGLTSVIGAAYTSVSFLKTLSKTVAKHEKYFCIGFIAFSTFVMSFVGRPAVLLVLAGSLNGLILPLTLGSMLLASRRTDIVGDYKHPAWLGGIGILTVIMTAYAGVMSLQNIASLF